MRIFNHYLFSKDYKSELEEAKKQIENLKTRNYADFVKSKERIDEFKRTIDTRDCTINNLTVDLDKLHREIEIMEQRLKKEKDASEQIKLDNAEYSTKIAELQSIIDKESKAHAETTQKLIDSNLMAESYKSTMKDQDDLATRLMTAISELKKSKDELLAELSWVIAANVNLRHAWKCGRAEEGLKAWLGDMEKISNWDNVERLTDARRALEEEADAYVEASNDDTAEVPQEETGKDAQVSQETATAEDNKKGDNTPVKNKTKRKKPNNNKGKGEEKPSQAKTTPKPRTKKK